jgi:hypothetical protein
MYPPFFIDLILDLTRDFMTRYELVCRFSKKFRNKWTLMSQWQTCSAIHQESQIHDLTFG